MTNTLPLAVKDNAEGQLNASISASSTTIPLKSGEGALMPQPIHGTATSAGSQNALNSTGIGASGVVVGDAILNLTDLSYSIITAVNTDDIETTDLEGGTDNTWQNSDKWVVNPFVLTLTARSGGVSTGTVTKMEKVLITERSVDDLACELTHRGFGGTTPAEFDADDFASVFWTEHNSEELKNAISRLFREKIDAEDAIEKSIGTAKGSVIAFSASGVPIEVPVGADGTVLMADSTEPAGVAFDNALGGENYILIRDEKPDGSHGGTFTTGSWQTRTLNTEVVDTGGNATLSSNQITLAAGTYRFRCTAGACNVNVHKAKLKNTTDSIEYIGTSEYSNTANQTTTSIVVGRFTIAAPKVFELQHRGNRTYATGGYGFASNFGVVEVYAQCEFWKEPT